MAIDAEKLAAMASFSKFHRQADLVVADPLLNTGDDFRYNDNWDEDPNESDPGSLIGLGDGSRYTKWNKFMIPRLRPMCSWKPSRAIQGMPGSSPLPYRNALAMQGRQRSLLYNPRQSSWGYVTSLGKDAASGPKTPEVEAL